VSYVWNIWSRQRVATDRSEFSIDGYTVIVEESITVEEEDIPTDVMLSLAEIKYLTTICLQPHTNEQEITDRVTKYAKQLAKEFNGVVEDHRKALLPQKRKTFSQAMRDADTISVCWYMDCRQSLSDQLADFIGLLEKYLPHALPRRYGAFEPPQFKYSQMGKEHLLKFLCDEHSPVIYCTKPVTYIFMSDAYIDNQKYKIKDYRCNKIEIEVLKEAYLQQNWQFAVKRLFKEAAKLLRPFYAEIIDVNESMMCAWWWKGLPARMGDAVIIGEPYSSLCGKLPEENEIDIGLYYFENVIHQLKLPRKLVSHKKLFAVKKPGKYFFAGDFNYARQFPFKKPGD